MIAAAVAADPAAAAESPRPFAPMALEWERSLDTIDKYVSARQSDDRYQRYQRVLAAIIDEAANVQAQAQRDVEAAQRLLEALGPVPPEGQPPETAEVGRQRKDLNETLALHRTRLAQAELTIARARALQQRLAEGSRARFYEEMATRYPSPVAGLSALRDGLVPMAAMANDWVAAPFAWYDGLAAEDRARLWKSAGLMMAAGAAAGWVCRRLLRRSLKRMRMRQAPGLGIEAAAAAIRCLAVFAPLAGAVAGFAVGLLAPPLAIDDLTRTIIVGACLVGAYAAFAVGAMREIVGGKDTPWQLTRLAPEAGRRLGGTALMIAALVVLDVVVGEVAALAKPPPEVVATAILCFTVAAAFAAIRFVDARAWKAGDAEDASAPASDADDGDGDGSLRLHWRLPVGRLIRGLVIVLAVAGPVAAGFGYSQFGRYLALNLLYTILAVLLFLLVRWLSRLLVLKLLRSIRAAKATAGQAGTAEDRFWLSLVLDPLFVIGALWLLAPAWRLPRENLQLWLYSLAQGVRVGGITISPVDALLAAITFALALAATRAIRNSLADRVLPRTRLDRGVRNSVAVGVGYVGVTVSALLAIAVLGIDLSSLALVAGALSVGIGFGLQNIVSNFISGLILLIERPVKVGDFVMIGDKQGFVRRIKVRSTELETFERSTIIVPNSDLLSQPVINWTHKDTIGRVDVRVGVAYGSDIQRVQAILISCASAHADITTRPPPFVLFQEFGDNALLFELRAFLFDVSKRLRVGSDLRLAIERAFREAGIEIPYAQREIWMTHIGAPDGETGIAAVPPLPTVIRSREG